MKELRDNLNFAQESAVCATKAVPQIYQKKITNYLIQDSLLEKQKKTQKLTNYEYLNQWINNEIKEFKEAKYMDLEVRKLKSKLNPSEIENLYQTIFINSAGFEGRLNEFLGMHENDQEIKAIIFKLAAGILFKYFKIFYETTWIDVHNQLHKENITLKKEVVKLEISRELDKKEVEATTLENQSTMILMKEEIFDFKQKNIILEELANKILDEKNLTTDALKNFEEALLMAQGKDNKTTTKLKKNELALIKLAERNTKNYDKIFNLKKKIKELNFFLEDAQKKADQTEKKFSEFLAVHINQKETLSKLQEEHSQDKILLTKLEAENNEKSFAVEQLKIKVQEIYCENKVFTSQVQDAVTQIKDHEGTIDSKNIEIQDLRNKLEGLKKVIEKYQKQLLALNVIPNNSKINSDHDATGVENVKQTDQNTYESSMDKFMIATLKNQIFIEEEKIEKLKTSLESAETLKNIYANETAVLRKDLNTVTMKVQELQNKNKQLQIEKNAENNEIINEIKQEYEIKLQQVRKECDQFRDNVNDSVRMQKEYKQELNKIKLEKFGMEQELQAKIEAVQKQNILEHNKNAQLNAMNDYLRASNTNLLDTLGNAQQDVRNLQAKIMQNDFVLNTKLTLLERIQSQYKYLEEKLNTVLMQKDKIEIEKSSLEHQLFDQQHEIKMLKKNINNLPPSVERCLMVQEDLMGNLLRESKKVEFFQEKAELFENRIVQGVEENKRLIFFINDIKRSLPAKNVEGINLILTLAKNQQQIFVSNHASDSSYDIGSKKSSRTNSKKALNSYQNGRDLANPLENSFISNMSDATREQKKREILSKVAVSLNNRPVSEILDKSMTKNIRDYNAATNKEHVSNTGQSSNMSRQIRKLMSSEDAVELNRSHYLDKFRKSDEESAFNKIEKLKNNLLVNNILQTSKDIINDKKISISNNPSVEKKINYVNEGSLKDSEEKTVEDKLTTSREFDIKGAKYHHDFKDYFVEHANNHSLMSETDQRQNQIVSSQEEINHRLISAINHTQTETNERGRKFSNQIVFEKNQELLMSEQRNQRDIKSLEQQLKLKLIDAQANEKFNDNRVLEAEINATVRESKIKQEYEMKLLQTQQEYEVYIYQLENELNELKEEVQHERFQRDYYEKKQQEAAENLELKEINNENLTVWKCNVYTLTDTVKTCNTGSQAGQFLSKITKEIAVLPYEVDFNSGESSDVDDIMAKTGSSFYPKSKVVFIENIPKPQTAEIAEKSSGRQKITLEDEKKKAQTVEKVPEKIPEKQPEIKNRKKNYTIKQSPFRIKPSSSKQTKKG